MTYFLARPDRVVRPGPSKNSKDTFYQIYRRDGSFKKLSRILPGDTVDERLRNRYGCTIGWGYTDSSYRLETDSRCNIIKSTYSSCIKGIWVPTTQYQYYYDEGRLAAYSKFGCPQTILENCSGKLRHHFTVRYEYDANGRVASEYYLSKRGRIFETIKYTYEMYE